MSLNLLITVHRYTDIMYAELSFHSQNPFPDDTVIIISTILLVKRVVSMIPP